MRQNFIGMVVSTAMHKTVKVRTVRQTTHPIVRKTIKHYKNFLAHDENAQCSLGDIVRIEECRPISRHKHFAVAEIMQAKKVLEGGQVEANAESTELVVIQ